MTARIHLSTSSCLSNWSPHLLATEPAHELTSLSVHRLPRAVPSVSRDTLLYDNDLLHKITDSQPVCTQQRAALSVHQPVQTYRYTLLACPIVIQMLAWWLKRLSLLIGACKGITAEGARRHTNFDMENHICELPNNIIYRGLNIPGKTFPVTPPSVVLD